MNKDKFLTKKQELEKKKLLLQLEKDIQMLDYQINNSKNTNRKIHMIRFLKYSLRFLQLITPYVITAGITFSIFRLLGGTPFIRDDVKKHLEIKKELDSFGNIRYEEQYDSFDNSFGTINYYTKWEQQADGFFRREIISYNSESIEEDIITKIISDNEINSLSDVFGEPVSFKTETKNNLSEEELNDDSYLQAVIYSKINDDFIIVKESEGDNISITLLYILVTILCELLTVAVRVNISEFDFKDCINIIKEKYPLVDIKELSKKLEIKKSNYNRFMR